MKGVEAPFQLLVSVFTMALVIALAYYVLSHAFQSRCGEQWSSDLARLALAIQQVGESGAGTKQSVRLHLHCGNSGDVVLRITELKNQTTCARVCGEVTDLCFALQIIAYDARSPKNKPEVLFTTRRCVRITPYVYNQLTKGGACPPGYEEIGSQLVSGYNFERTPFVDIMVYRPNDTSLSMCKRVT